jgi:fluoride exporter
MTTYLWIAIGSAFGGIARYWCSEFTATHLGNNFPFGTLFVNILGCFIIGLFVALTGPSGKFFVHPDIRLFIMVGICGGFTTFSAFSLQTVELLRDGKFMSAGINITFSVALCMVAVWLGFILASSINPIK